MYMYHIQASIPTSLTLPVPTSPPPTTCDVIPLDWSLKTRVRFVSPFPFSWALSLKPQQEAAGITQFVRNRDGSVSHTLKDEEKVI